MSLLTAASIVLALIAIAEVFITWRQDKKHPKPRYVRTPQGWRRSR